MYRLHILHGKKSIRHFDEGEYGKISPGDLDVLEFWTAADGLKYIREIEKSKKKDFIYLTLGEFEEIIIELQRKQI